MGYETLQFEPAQSTPSQTAWALLGLIAAGAAASSSARRGVQWLRHHQRADGSWDEKVTTGTGFPNVFYISYHLYRDYFPLLALTAYASDASSDSEAAAFDTPTAIAAVSL